MDIHYSPNNNTTEDLINFAKKVFDYKSNEFVEVDLESLFPTFKYDALDDFWLLNLLDKIPEISDDKQKIAYKLLELANIHYYNLFDVLERRYAPHSEYNEKRKEFMISPFFGDVDLFALWSADLKKEDYKINPNPILSLIMDNASIMRTDNSDYSGYRREEFFQQLGVQTRVLISNSTLDKMLQVWESHQTTSVPPYSHKSAPPYFHKEGSNIASKNEFIEIISGKKGDYLSEVGGIDVRATLIEALNTDSIGDVKKSTKKIYDLLGDYGDDSYGYLLYTLLNHENKEIQLEAMKYVYYGLEWFGVGNKAMLMKRVIELGLQNSKNIKVLHDVYSFLYALRDDYKKNLEFDIDIYNQYYQREYYCENTQINFYPLRGNSYGDKEVTKDNLLIDINSTSLSLLEMKNTTLPNWERFVLSNLGDVLSLDKDTQLLVANLVGSFASADVSSVLKKLQQSPHPIVQFQSGKNNQNGRNKENLW